MSLGSLLRELETSLTKSLKLVMLIRQLASLPKPESGFLKAELHSALPYDIFLNFTIYVCAHRMKLCADWFL